MALVWAGSATPFQRIRNRSASVLPRSTSTCGTIGSPRPRAAWAANDSTITATRDRSSRACSSEMS